MKIAVIIRHYHKHGGTSRVVAELCENLSNLGLEVHVFSGSFPPADKPRNPHFHLVPCIKSRRFFFLEVLSFAFFAALCVRHANRKERFDVINAHEELPIKGAYTTYHSCHLAWVKKYGGNISTTDKLILWLTRKNLSESKKIIAVSEGLKHELLEFYDLPEEKITVIPNGINLKEFSSDPVQRKMVRSRYSIKENERVALFVSNDFGRKGLPYCLEAVGLLKDEAIRLLVVGADRIPFYKNLAKNLGIEDKVTFAGQSKNVKEFYSASDLFLLPSTHESFALVTLEALAASLPVLRTKTAGFEEQIEEGKNGYAISQNPQDIAEKIKFLIRHPQEFDKMKRRATEKARDFSWEKIARQYKDLFEKERQ